MPRNEQLRLDELSVLDAFSIGYPINGRTMFKGVRMLRPWTRVEVTASEVVESPLGHDDPLSGSSGQHRGNTSSENDSAQAFLSALDEIAIEESVLSLSGGIDSRTVLAGLLLLGKKPHLATQTGQKLSLDAEVASQIAAAYQLDHSLVVLGADFTRDIVALATEASMRSGGFRSLEYAHLVYFQSQLRTRFKYRVTGNGGNQLCRNGLEGLSYRNADASILGPALAVHERRSPGSHWLSSITSPHNSSLKATLINSELPWAFGGGGIFGSAPVVEACPYLNPVVTYSNLSTEQAGSGSPAFDPRTARLHDIAHRFLGPSRSTSWQRRMICDAGGALANIPVNWGWRPRGGYSLRGLGRGLRAGVEAKLTLMSTQRKVGNSLRKSVGASGTHQSTDYSQLLAVRLRDFAMDLFESGAIRDAGLFDSRSLSKTANLFFGGTESVHYSTIVSALDLALAFQNFCSERKDMITSPDMTPVEITIQAGGCTRSA